MSGGQDTREKNSLPLELGEFEKIGHEQQIGPGAVNDPDFDVKEDEKDLVDHPHHYNQGTIETIDFIEDRDYLGFNRQNAIKYIDRSGAKSTETKEVSLRKAIWYLERELGMHKKEHKCNCE